MFLFIQDLSFGVPVRSHKGQRDLDDLPTVENRKRLLWREYARLFFIVGFPTLEEPLYDGRTPVYFRSRQGSSSGRNKLILPLSNITSACGITEMIIRRETRAEIGKYTLFQRYLYGTIWSVENFYTLFIQNVRRSWISYIGRLSLKRRYKIEKRRFWCGWKRATEH